MQGRIEEFALEGVPLPFSPILSPLLLSSCPFPLEVGPLKPARGLGSAVSSPAGSRA